MKIGVISDSHDRLPTLQRAVSLFRRLRVDAVLHAGDLVAPFAAKLLTPEGGLGDLPLHVVYGNNDGEKAGLKKVLPGIVDGPLRVTLGGKKIVMAHFVDWLKPGDVNGADVVVTGHTHEIVNESKDGKLYLNPGECCGWVTGRCTVAMLDLSAMKAEVVEVHP